MSWFLKGRQTRKKVSVNVSVISHIYRPCIPYFEPRLTVEKWRCPMGMAVLAYGLSDLTDSCPELDTKEQSPLPYDSSLAVGSSAQDKLSGHVLCCIKLDSPSKADRIPEIVRFVYVC